MFGMLRSHPQKRHNRASALISSAQNGHFLVCELVLTTFFLFGRVATIKVINALTPPETTIPNAYHPESRE
jgi:hypothetical protein